MQENQFEETVELLIIVLLLGFLFIFLLIWYLVIVRWFVCCFWVAEKDLPSKC